MIIMVALGGSVPCHAADPLLFFQNPELPALKERIQEPQYSGLWAEALKDAEDFSDPKSDRYANPEELITTAKADAKSSLPGQNQSGRKLSVWMEALGFAYQFTGDERFSRHGVALLEAASDPSVSLVVKEALFPGSRGDMMKGLAIGLDLLSTAMTPEQRAKITAAAKDYLLHHVEDYSTPEGAWTTTRLRHNFNGVCGGAVGMLALALREDFPEEVPAWLNLAEKMILDWLNLGFDQDGSYVEGVLYMRYGLGNPVIFADAMWRYQKRKAILENDHFKKIPFFLAMQMLPGESEFDAWNDSLYEVDLGGKSGVGSPFLLLFASGFRDAVPENPLAAWLWEKTGSSNVPAIQIIWANKVRGTNPDKLIEQPYGALFKDRGLCVWRTGWNKGDFLFSTEAGPYYPITHNQADKGHFNFYGLGYRWAVDAGYGNDRDPDGRAQTSAHSCVLVDGRGQAKSGAGVGTDGKVLKYENTSRYGYALMDLVPAYRSNNKGQLGAPVTKALRHTFFVRPNDGIPAYALILDDIEDEGQEHRFTWQMMAWPDMRISTPDKGGFVLTPPGKAETTPRMEVSIIAANAVELSQDVYSPKNKQALPNQFKRLKATMEGSNPQFAALLTPLPAGMAPPVFSVEPVEGGRLIQVRWPNRTDRFKWTENGATLLSNDDQ